MYCPSTARLTAANVLHSNYFPKLLFLLSNKSGPKLHYIYLTACSDKHPGNCYAALIFKGCVQGPNFLLTQKKIFLKSAKRFLLKQNTSLDQRWTYSCNASLESWAAIILDKVNDVFHIRLAELCELVQYYLSCCALLPCVYSCKYLTRLSLYVHTPNHVFMYWAIR